MEFEREGVVALESGDGGWAGEGLAVGAGVGYVGGVVGRAGGVIADLEGGVVLVWVGVSWIMGVGGVEMMGWTRTDLLQRWVGEGFGALAGTVNDEGVSGGHFDVLGAVEVGLVWTVSEDGEEREDLGRELRREKQGSYTPLG